MKVNFNTFKQPLQRGAEKVSKFAKQGAEVTANFYKSHAGAVNIGGAITSGIGLGVLGENVCEKI